MRVPLLVKWPLYMSFRWFGWPRVAPISLTISLTNHCNHRCKTCDVYDNVQDDFSPEEWDRLFRSVSYGLSLPPRECWAPRNGPCDSCRF